MSRGNELSLGLRLGALHPSNARMGKSWAVIIIVLSSFLHFFSQTINTK